MWAYVKERAGLEGQILARIKALAKRRAYAWGILGVGAGASLVYALTYTYQSIAGSGSFEYLSLLFTSAGTVAGNWYEFSLAMLETLPITEIAVSLSVLLVLLWSIDKVIKNIWIQKAYRSSYSGL